MNMETVLTLETEFIYEEKSWIVTVISPTSFLFLINCFVSSDSRVHAGLPADVVFIPSFLYERQSSILTEKKDT